MDAFILQAGFSVDTACAKSVGGRPAAQEAIEECKRLGWPYKVVKEKEPFRFGPGKRIWSQEALLVGVLWAAQVFVLRVSIVEAEVPFLISKYVIKRLTGVLDFDSNEMILKKLSQKPEPLYDLESGHVGDRKA